MVRISVGVSVRIVRGGFALAVALTEALGRLALGEGRKMVTR